MVLFEVPGWDTPKEGPSSTPSKKRKRPSSADDSKLQAAHVNLEKLVKKLDRKDNHDESHKKRKSDASSERPRDERTETKKPKGKSHVDQQRPSSGSSKITAESDHVSSRDRVSTESNPPKDKDRKRKRKNKQLSSERSSDHVHDYPKHAKTAQPQDSPSQLTSLQENMKKSLDGARFR